MTPEERVERLVTSGSVPAVEGERLLAAMHRPANRSLWGVLINPFERFGGGTAAAMGLLVSGASLALTRLGIRFDGALDLHIARAHVPTIATSLTEQALAWIFTAACFWVYALITARQVRFLDFVGMVGLARLPLLIAALPVLAIKVEINLLKPTLTPSLLVLSMTTLVFVVWNITLLYQGFKNASGLAGAKLLGGFVGVLVAAEILSKLLLVWLA